MGGKGAARKLLLRVLGEGEGWRNDEFGMSNDGPEYIMSYIMSGIFFRHLFPPTPATWKDDWLLIRGSSCLGEPCAEVYGLNVF
jgi:hypothetical protein